MPRRAHAVTIPALAAVVSLAGCVGANDDSTIAERRELGNIRPWNVVPNASPRTLVATFKRYCLDGPADAARAAAMLRSASFVPQGGWVGGLRAFVVDDSRPQVIISDDGRGCAVSALSRTGQTQALTEMIADRLPQAQALGPTGRAVEQVWATGRTPRERILLIRDGTPAPLNKITIALQRH